MAQGSSNMTTFQAKHLIGDSTNTAWAGALLHSGTDGKTGSMDTWIYADDYGTTAAPWGIKHNQNDNNIEYVGAGTTNVKIHLGESKITASHLVGGADTWYTARTLTIGATGKSVNGSADVSWSMNDIMGSSDSSKFYRGDKTWSNTLNGVLLLPQGLKTGGRASGSGSGIEISTDGGIEIFNSSTPFIDFHYQASTADYSIRLICKSATELKCTTNFTAAGSIYADGGYLKSTLNSNTVTIGSANTSWCHIENSANIPFYFNKAIHVNGDIYYYNTKVHMSSSGFHPPKNGGIYWDPYVESASDASDVTQIIQVASGAAGGTELRIQQANDAADIINLVTPKSIYLNSKEAFNVNDAWLRINENAKFTSGVYFGSSTVRTDGEFWSDKVRIVDDWVGFYNAVQGGTRYGFLEVTSTKYYFRKENGADSWPFDFNGNIYTSGILRSDTEVRGDQLRMIDNWLGFYQSSNAGGSRYGYIQCNANRMYFVKENGVSTYHFDFNGHLYTTGGISIATNTTSFAASTPMALAYGRVQCYGTLCINANTDNSGTEYVILTAGHGCSGSTSDGLWVGSSSAGLFGQLSYGTDQWMHGNAGQIYWGGNFHLDSKNSYHIYLNYHNASRNIYFGNQGYCIYNNGANYNGNAANADTLDGYHHDSFAKIAAHNNLTASGNEFTFLSSGFSGEIYLNYRTAGGQNGNCTWYRFNNGAGGWSGIRCGNIWASDSLYVSQGNVTGGGIILADDGDIVDLNDGYCSMRFSYGVRIFSANRSGSAVITLYSSGHLYASGELMAPKHLRIGSTILRDDGADVYFLVGTRNSAGDNWNGLRPFMFNLSNGVVRFGHGAYGAVWNDFAEFRKSSYKQAGHTVVEDGYGCLKLCQERLAAGARIISDTFGMAVGQSLEQDTPIGIGGRVLAYTFQNRNNFKVGDAVCAAPNGTIDLMTREEIKEYPDRIIGIVSEIPQYEIWTQQGAKDMEPVKVKVNNRIWVYVR